MDFVFKFAAKVVRKSCIRLGNKIWRDFIQIPLKRLLCT